MRLLLSFLLVSPVLAQVHDGAAVTSMEGSPEPHVELLERTLTLRESALRAGAAGGRALPPSGSFLSVDSPPEGDMPRDLAFSADGSEAVIVNRDTDTVTFFDVTSQTITDTVSVGDFPVHVATSPDGAYAVVPNPFSNTVSVIDMGTHAVTNVPVTGVEPYRVAITSDSAFAVVGVVNDAVSSSCSVIDLATKTEVMTFGTTPQGVFGFFFSPESGIFGNVFTRFALSPDDTTLVLPDRFNDQVAVYDITTGTETLLATDDAPSAVDVSSDGLLAVIGLDGTGASVAKIDLTVPAVTGSFVTGSTVFLAQVRVTPDKSHAIIAVQNAVEFIDLTTGTVASTVGTGTVGDIEISFDGQYALVPNFNFRIIDIATRSLVKSISVAPAYDAAVSPVEHRAVALNNRFREDVQLYDTDGASGFFEGKALSGRPVEADAPRSLALTPDGKRAVVANNISNSVTVVDLVAGNVAGYASAGERVLGVAVSPDGGTAVATNGTSDTASVVDLTTLTEVATLSVPATPAEVAISPDGTQAYVTSLAGTDRLWFIDLAGGGSAVNGSLITGQMGSIGYSYGVFSGIALSPDGSVLAICISFDDELLLVDTATKSELDRVPVGDFPIRATFSSDGTKVYVTHSFGDSLVEVTVNGASSFVSGTAGGIEFPLQVTLDADDAFAYVGSWDFASPTVDVVDTATMNVVAAVPLTSRPRSHSASGDQLFVSLTDGDLARLRMAGAATTVVETTPLAGSPAGMAFSGPTGRAVSTQPGAADGVDLVTFGGAGTLYCQPAVPNSTGLPGEISATGSFLAGGLPLELTASQLPRNKVGYFLTSQTQDFVPTPPGSKGNLCLGGTIGRYAPLIQSSGPGGTFSIAVDTQAMPPNPPQAILPGETWNFQAWHRDKNPGPTSNFTDAIAIQFE